MDDMTHVPLGMKVPSESRHDTLALRTMMVVLECVTVMRKDHHPAEVDGHTGHYRIYPLTFMQHAVEFLHLREGLFLPAAELAQNQFDLLLQRVLAFRVGCQIQEDVTDGP